MKSNKAQKHHCDVCGKMGDLKVCIRKGHMTSCEKHPDAVHSTYQQCVKCTAERKRVERERRESNLVAINAADSGTRNTRKPKKKENQRAGGPDCLKDKKDKRPNDRARRRSSK